MPISLRKKVAYITHFTRIWAAKISKRNEELKLLIQSKDEKYLLPTFFKWVINPLAAAPEYFGFRGLKMVIF